MPIITAPRDRLRLQIGDTTSPNLFSDDELDTLLSERNDEIVLAAADACDILATRFATNYDFKWKDGSFNRSQMAKMYADRAKELRERSSSGLSTLGATRVDGYSEDLDATSGAGQASKNGRVRTGYTDPDLPY